MKRTIRLNERELTTLVRRVINENDDNLSAMDDDFDLNFEADKLKSEQIALEKRMKTFIKNANEIYKKLDSIEDNRSDYESKSDYESNYESRNDIYDSYEFAQDIEILLADSEGSFFGSEDPLDNQVSERHFKNKRRY